MEVGDVVYLARIIPGILYDCLDLKLRTVEDTWCVGVEMRDNQAFFFGMCDIDKTVFLSRDDAVNKCKKAEKEFGKKYAD